ncbi:hypothetical protein [Photobacterium frigidiphilum]
MTDKKEDFKDKDKDKESDKDTQVARGSKEPQLAGGNGGATGRPN